MSLNALCLSIWYWSRISLILRRISFDDSVVWYSTISQCFLNVDFYSLFLLFHICLFIDLPMFPPSPHINALRLHVNARRKHIFRSKGDPADHSRTESGRVRLRGRCKHNSYNMLTFVHRTSLGQWVVCKRTIKVRPFPMWITCPDTDRIRLPGVKGVNDSNYVAFER